MYFNTLLYMYAYCLNRARLAFVFLCVWLVCEVNYVVNRTEVLVKCNFIVSYFVQVNPHTHQVKLCDFGSAKVLVCFINLVSFLFALFFLF